MTERSTVSNLDQLAAQHAQAIIASTKDKKASEVDNTVTKALGVLQENGVYACFLYLLSKEAKEGGNGKIVAEEMLKLLEGLKFGWDTPKKNGEIDTTPDVVLKHVSKKVTAGSLERLLLAKETLEQMLIYARYGAKARSAAE